MKRLDARRCIMTGGSRDAGKARCRSPAAGRATIAVTDIEKAADHRVHHEIAGRDGSAEFAVHGGHQAR